VPVSFWVVPEAAALYFGAVVRSNTTDEFYVAVPPKQVYDSLVDAERIDGWWPGGTASGGGGRLALKAPAFQRLARPVRFEARVDGLRDAEGLTWWLESGELRGRGEWWLEAFKAGTIVHYYLEVERPKGSRRGLTKAVRRHRWAVRRGVNALKDRLEGRAPIT